MGKTKKKTTEEVKPEPIINIVDFASSRELTVTLLAGFKYFTSDNNIFRTRADWDVLYSQYLNS